MATVPSQLHELADETDDARATKAEAIVEHIDATMPEHALFVNYRLDPTDSRLLIDYACGFNGEKLDLTPFVPVVNALEELGKPYTDFDGDLLVNSFGDFGWERSEDYDADRDRAAAEARERATAAWRQALDRQQAAAAESILRQVGADVEAVAFTWDKQERQLTLTAIHRGGRTEHAEATGRWAGFDDLAEFITHPDLASLERDEAAPATYRLRAPHP